jgi:hypothetical protein
MSDLSGLLKSLMLNQVEFILVGGMAATLHGSPRLTVDIDVVYHRTPENLKRVVNALAPHSPYLRGAPEGLPFQWDERTLAHGFNFTLTTQLGPIDLFAEIPGGGNYEHLYPDTTRISVFGMDLVCLDLDKLIEVKRAAGRPKDFEGIAELETIRECQEAD